MVIARVVFDPSSGFVDSRPLQLDFCLECLAAESQDYVSMIPEGRGNFDHSCACEASDQEPFDLLQTSW